VRTTLGLLAASLLLPLVPLPAAHADVPSAAGPSACGLAPLPPSPALTTLHDIVATGRGHLAAIGSSTTYGVGASDQAHRWVDRFMAGLAGRGYAVNPVTVGQLDPKAVLPQSRLTLVDAAVPGATAATPLIDPGAADPIAVNYLAAYLPGLLVARLTGQAPAIVIHMVGANDYADGVAPAAYRAGLEAGAEEFPGAVQVFVGAYQDPGVTTGTHPWSAYGDAARAVAAEDPRHRLFVDLAPWFEAAGIGQGDPYGFVSPDGVHPTDVGHAAIAALVLRALGYGC